MLIHACYHADCDEDDQEVHECDKWKVCAECEDIERSYKPPTNNDERGQA